MAQIFHRSFNTITRVVIASVLVLAGAGGAAGYLYVQSPAVTGEKIAREQPVPFSHLHHVGQLGIDCRYCHTSVETAAFAGYPPTKTCMNCHQQVWVGSKMLEPVRESYKKNESIPWVRLHNMAQFVYFNHSVHVNKGIGCVSCHGRVDQMPLMWQNGSLLMQWCLDCHRAPEQHIRPRSEVFNLNWQKPADYPQLAAKLIDEYHVQKLESCSVCHR